MSNDLEQHGDDQRACPAIYSRGLLDTENDTQHLAVAIYRRLATGAPATPGHLAEVLETTPAQIDSLIGCYPPTSFDFERHGAVVAFGGLSLIRTAHEFLVSGARLYTWCVLDALFLPEIIGLPAILKTKCAASGDQIEVHLDHNRIRRRSPEGIVMSIVGPDRQACRENLRGAFCQHVLLFRNENAFRDWSAERADVAFVSLDEAHGMGRERNAARYPDVKF